MESLVDIFYIDIKLLIAQVINFAIVFVVLYFFVIKPILRAMQERTKKIEKSLEDAKEIEKRVGETKKECDMEISNAKKIARDIMERADDEAEERKKKIIDSAREDINQIIIAEKEKMQFSRAKILKELKTEVAELVGISLEKILSRGLDSDKDREFMEKILKNEK